MQVIQKQFFCERKAGTDYERLRLYTDLQQIRRTLMIERSEMFFFSLSKVCAMGGQEKECRPEDIRKRRLHRWRVKKGSEYYTGFYLWFFSCFDISGVIWVLYMVYKGLTLRKFMAAFGAGGVLMLLLVLCAGTWKFRAEQPKQADKIGWYSGVSDDLFKINL